MRYLFYIAWGCFAFSIALSSCKIDKPIYPDSIKPITTDTSKTDTIPVDNGPETIPDTGPDATYTIAIGDTNTVVFKVDGAETVTLKGPKAIVTQPGAVTLTGYTSIVADQTDPEIFFQLNFSAVHAGEIKNDLLGLIFKTYKLADDGSGKVKVVIVKKVGNTYDVKGYFKVVCKDDNNGSLHTVTGSFNVSH